MSGLSEDLGVARDPSGGPLSSGDSASSVAEAFFEALAHASGDLDDDLPSLLRVVAESLGFEVATMWWWKPEEGMLRCEHGWQAPGANCASFLELARRSVLAPGEPIPGAVFQDCGPIWVTDVARHPNFRRGPAATEAGLRTGVAFPIRARGEMVGVFELFSTRELPADPTLLDSVATAAIHLGDFIERLNVHAERDRLLEEFAVMHRQQRFLLDANRALSSTKGLDATINRLAKVAVPAIGDLCLVDVVNSDGEIDRLIAYHADRSVQWLAGELARYPPQPHSDHPAAAAIRSGISKVGADMPDGFLAATTRGAHHFEVARQLQSTSYVCAPLISSTGSIGAITVVSAGSARRFGGEELQLLEQLAAQVASVIERERRFDEQRQVALILQRSMLPRVTAPSGLDTCVRYFSSDDDTEAGGDFYDVVPLDSRSVALVIGDVQGHDLVAITTMAKVRNALRALLQNIPSLEEVVRALDWFLIEQSEPRFVTLALARLDILSGQFELVLAGHPPPLLVGETVDVVKCHPGPPVGIADPTSRRRYEESRGHLDIETGLLLYTDGLVETPSGGPDAKLPQLIEAVHQHRLLPLAAACDKVIEQTLTGDSPTDDIAVLWARRTGRLSAG